MITRLTCAIALASVLIANAALAGPPVYEETARLIPPDSRYTEVESVALDGDRMVMASTKLDEWPFVGSIFLFERAANGSWQYVAPVWLDQPLNDSSMTYHIELAIQGNVIAATTYDRLLIFERVGTSWVNTATFYNFPEVNNFGADVEVDGDTVMVAADGFYTYDGIVVRKNASGQWVRETTLHAALHEFDSETNGSAVALSGNVGVVATPATPDYVSSEMFIYERSGTAWTNTGHFTTFPANSFGSLTTDGTNVVATGGTEGADATIYRRIGGAWSPTQTLNAQPGFISSLALGSGFVAGGAPWTSIHGVRSGAVDIYNLAASGHFTQPVARLLTTASQTDDGFGGGLDVSGRRILATSARAAYIYDLPTSFPQQPAIVQEDFNSGSAANWSPIPGSSFSLVTDASGSTVYRQTSLTGDAGALRNNTDWTHQSIQASITPHAFDGTDRWFGLVVRQQDASNYYYVTVRSTNVIQLKRMLNGQLTTLAFAGMPVTLNQTYSVRLEAAGTILRVFVNGQEMLQARDTSISHGQAGIRMYKTSADFDNVLVTPNPQNDAFPANFEGPWDGFGAASSGTWDKQKDGSWVYTQSSLDVTARSYVYDYANAADQIVQVRAKANEFAAGATERWFGVAGRVTDDNNYYYMTVRNSNRISLRKLVNGTITELDFAPMTVALGRWYALRFEIVGDRLKGYVNDMLMVEATDSTFARGKSGLITVKTSASFDDFSMLQP
jgi:hypothetical protein